jgi:hypothetical protein
LVQALAAQIMKRDQRSLHARCLAEKQLSMQRHSVDKSPSTEQRRSTQVVPLAQSASSGQPQRAFLRQLSQVSVVAPARLSQRGAKRLHTAGSMNGEAAAVAPAAPGQPPLAA